MIQKSNNRNLADYTRPVITRRHIWMVALAFISIVAAVILSQVPTWYQGSIIFIILAVIGCLFILRNPYIGVYLYLIFEFLRPYDFFPALVPLRPAMAIVIITLVSWLKDVAIKKERIRWSNFHWLFLGFLGVMAITVITAENNRYAYDTSRRMAATFIIFLVATNVADSHGRLRKIIWLLLLIHFYFALKGIYNFAILHTSVAGQVTSGYVGSGYIGDEGDYALSLNVMLPFAFFMLVYSKEKMKKFVSAVILLAFLFAVVSSFSRGGWVGLMAVTAYFIFGSKRKIVALGYTLLLAMGLVLFAPSSYWDEIKTIKETRKGTAEERRRYWEAAFRIYLDHPIIGVGAGNGGIWMPEYVTGLQYPERHWGRAFHGTIPQVMAELGSLGLVFYLMMIFYAIRHLSRLKERKHTKVDDDFTGYVADSILGGIIAYLVTSIFLSTAYYPQLWTLFTLTVILSYYQESKATDLDQSDIEAQLANRIRNI